MLHDYSNENVGETNSEKTKKKIVKFELGKFTIQNVHRWNPHDLKLSKIYSLVEKKPNTLRYMKG